MFIVREVYTGKTLTGQESPTHNEHSISLQYINQTGKISDQPHICMVSIEIKLLKIATVQRR